MQRKEKQHELNKLTPLGSFSVLPNELISEITSKMNYMQIANLSRVSKDMHSLVDQSLTSYKIQGKNSTFAAIRQVLTRRRQVRREIVELEKDPRYSLYKFYARFQYPLDLMFSLSVGVLLAPPSLSPSENQSLQVDAKHIIKSFALIGVAGATLLFTGKDFSKINALQQELAATPDLVCPQMNM